MSDDKNIDLLNSRLSDISTRLEQHVTDCAAQSRKLFWAVVGLTSFLVLKSLPFLSKMFPS